MHSKSTHAGVRISQPHGNPRYAEVPAGTALAPHVACFWSFEIPEQALPFRHAIIPDGTVSLALVQRRAPVARLLTVTGPSPNARWVTVSPGDTFRGVRLLPGAAPVLLGIATRALQAQSQPLSSLNPTLAQALLEPLARAETSHQVFHAMAQALSPLAARAPQLDPIISRTVDVLQRAHGNARVCTLAKHSDISERQLRRRFHAAVGLTPKQFSRAIRVRSACIRLAMSPTTSLATIAHETGYADQAHLSREFSQVFGSRASGLSALIRGYQHGTFEGLLADEGLRGRECPIRSRQPTMGAGIK